jgi:alpha-beta hydrolase superfamily lysophospholipase
MTSMPLSSEVRSVSGLPVMWHRWIPEGEICGAIFFLHGQGDFAERYGEVAAVFAAQGFAFLTCDLPGHGRTEGPRGHVPSQKIVEQIASLGFEEACALAPNPDQRVGFGGHSAGGLLALACLPLLEKVPDFAWVSSPLLVPEGGQAPWKPLLLRPLSHLFPRTSLSTGVTTELCRLPLPGESSQNSLLFHSRISLAWGRALMDIARNVRASPERLPATTVILMTHGEEDLICPPNFSRRFAESYRGENLNFRIIPNARHEPFADSSKEEFFDLLRHWLSSLKDSRTAT